MKLIAHIKIDSDVRFAKPHYLYDHLFSTAKLCRKMADGFGLGNIGFIIGLLHDLGKASNAFQLRIRIKSKYKLDAQFEGKTAQHVDHSTAGAQYLCKKYGLGPGVLLAYTIAGHHAGLPDGKGVSDSSLIKRLKKKIENYDSMVTWIDEKIPNKLNPSEFITAHSTAPLLPHILIRMLFSVLTDADFLDTESYMAPEKKELRNGETDLNKLFTVFNSYLETLKCKEKSLINKKRNEILEQCINAAKSPIGIFSLTVPTGGGKTISSMAFALEHAKKHNLKRIIYVIPYTSIIEQNAHVFRDIFYKLGGEIVMEHHSNLEPKKDTAFNRLASQNWDAPVIVTTNVQFFESFYKHRTSACRKLHNIAGSVIIFDEAQMFPPEHLQPALSVIQELNKNYGCTVVLCTATQPVLNKTNLVPCGLENIKEVITNPRGLYNSLKRVKITCIEDVLPDDKVAERLCLHDQALAIVNTRKEARGIFEFLPDDAAGVENFHLSAMMCPEHRTHVLDKIRLNIKGKKPCRVVSTQVIEAGVDVDFPFVYRAVAGLDSIAQAAGRCNRENKVSEGNVFVFQGETSPPPGYLRQSAESGLRALKQFSEDPLSLDAIKSYFNDFYGKQKLAHGFDKKGIQKMCKAPIDAIPFREISKEFSLIEDGSRSIIVPYGDVGKELIEVIKSYRYQFVPREIIRKVQRFTVQVHQNIYLQLKSNGVLEDLFEDEQFLALINNDIYSENLGLIPDDPSHLDIKSTII